MKPKNVGLMFFSLEPDKFMPYAAIEEALANAVYHKAYDVREPIEVRVEADRIEILSFPGPDRSVTREGLKTYRVTNRRYRNRRIGEFLKELHLTEGRNTGFRKILNALERNGSPMPEFETDEEHSYFITRFFIREGFDINTNADANGTNVTNLGTNGTNQKMNELAEQKVLLLLQDNGKITQKMIEERAGIPLRTVKRIMSELQKQGRILRIGSSRSGEWHVQK